MRILFHKAIAMDWENHYLDKHTPWDKGAAAPPLLEWVDSNPGAISGKVMIPGSGKGHDGRALVEKTDASHVIGLDISPSAVASANIENGSAQFQSEVGDLFDLPPAHQSAFDWVWEHTCFCAIEPEMRDAYVEAVHLALKPDGELLAVFYRDPYDDEHSPGEGPPHGTTVEELRERFEGSGRFQILESYVPRASYDGREGLEQMMRLKPL
ncbi:MAG: methyltransferase domain-containing protein [Verrucomicrobiales bacterium]|nr:methyltransferase domain-containing protein [Verrucomicrobiales bacterium]